MGRARAVRHVRAAARRCCSTPLIRPSSRSRPTAGSLSWNTVAESMFGRPRADVIGLSLAGAGVALDRRRQLAADRRPELASRLTVRRECEGVRAVDGSTFPALVVDPPMYQPKMAILQGIFRIVTDLTRQDGGSPRKLTLREARWQALVSRSADVASIAEPSEHRVTFVSPAVSRLFGWQPEEIVGQLGRSFVHPEDADRVAEALALVKADPSGHPTVEFRLLCADDSYRWVEETISNLIDEPPSQWPRGEYSGHSRPANRRGRPARLRARYRLIAETAQEGIWAVDTAGRTIYANQKLAELLGYSLDAIYAMREFRCRQPESRAELRQPDPLAAGRGARVLRDAAYVARRHRGRAADLGEPALRRRSLPRARSPWSPTSPPPGKPSASFAARHP